MDLPVRIVDPADPAQARTSSIQVDGVWRPDGLHLSHWPGHRTPPELRRELSTGVALAFARLPAERRRELARGCGQIANNHYDTDGTCALFAVRHPEQALEREEALLAAARAGDFFQLPCEGAFVVDAIVEGLAGGAGSPLAASLAGLPDLARHQAATDFLLRELPAILDGDVEPFRALWEEPRERLREDLAQLRACDRDEVVHLDWTVWTEDPSGARARAGAAPGRHALLSTGSDRTLWISAASQGTRCRLVLSTLSWFDIDRPAGLPRPALETLAARLNDLEGLAPDGERAWRCQPSDSPSPELWFGAAELERFAEHNEALRESYLDPSTVRREVAEALRRSALAELSSG